VRLSATRARRAKNEKNNEYRSDAARKREKEKADEKARGLALGFSFLSHPFKFLFLPIN
jgi:hypothetical protein